MSQLLDRATAAEYASWFRALADPSRVQLVELLARAKRAMSVGEIVEAMGLAQSTVSQHLKILAEVRFVLVEPIGNARYYRVNEECIGCFPSAADLVMGKTGACRVPARGRSMTVTIRPMNAGDADSVLRIYQAGLDSGQASFETTAPPWGAFDVGKLADHRYVAILDCAVIGWVAAASTSTRPVYPKVAPHRTWPGPARPAPARRVPRRGARAVPALQGRW